MILLHRMVDGFRKYEEFARIEDGEVVEGRFDPPPDVDLSDEEALLYRYSGPGIIATQITEDAIDGECVAGNIYKCTMCGTTQEADHDATESERWVPCHECGKDLLFELTGERE